MLSQVIKTTGAAPVSTREASFIQMLDKLNSDGLLKMADFCEHHESGDLVSMAAPMRRLAATRRIEEELD